MMNRFNKEHDDIIASELESMTLPTSQKDRMQSFKKNLKENLMFEFDRKMEAKSKPSFSTRLFKVFSHALVTAILMPLLVLGGVSSYAYYSPYVYEGNVLYPIKLSVESVEYSFAKTPSEKAEKKLTFANKRLQEVEAYYDEKKDIDKNTLSKVANYTLSAVMDVKKISDASKKEKLESMVRDFSREQLNVIVSLEDKTKYIAFNDSNKSLSNRSNSMEINQEEKLGVGSQEREDKETKEIQKLKTQNTDSNIQNQSPKEDVIDNTSSVISDSFDFAQDRLVGKPELLIIEDETIRSDNLEKQEDNIVEIKDMDNDDEEVERDQDEDIKEDNTKEIFYDENVVAFENQIPEKIVTEGVIELPSSSDVNNEQKEVINTFHEPINELDTHKDNVLDYDSSVNSSTTNEMPVSTSNEPSNISSETDEDSYYENNYPEKEIISSSFPSQKTYHPFVSNDKGGDVEALEYIKNISNELKDFGARESFANTVVTAEETLYEPRLYFYPSIEDYKLSDLEGYQYLIQTRNNFIFYVYPYFIDGFEVYVPKSIYDDEVEIYYTKDNSNPFSSSTRETYHIGEMLDVDRNITLKFVVVSGDTVSPTYTVQVSIVRGEKIQHSTFKMQN